MEVLGALAILVFAFAVVSRRLDGTVVTAPMAFVAAGLVAGWTGLLDLGGVTEAGGEHEAAREAMFLVAELALVLLLFTDATRVRPGRLRGNVLPLRLLLVGLPLTIGLGTVVALAVLTDLQAWECAVVAAVLAPTDAALGQAVVSSPLVPERIGESLHVESGLNDGGSVPFLMVFLALAAADAGLGEGWVRFSLEQIGYGALIGGTLGAAGGWALRRAAERGWALPSFEQLGLAALAIAVWFIAEQAGGNGFIAAFVGGAAAGRTAGPLRERVLQFAEEEGQVLNLAVFFAFGIFASAALPEATGPSVAYAVLSLTAIRMLPVAVATAGLRLPLSTVAFLGWFGPRGLASIILGFVVVQEQPELSGLDSILVTVTLTVLLSVFAHGITAAPLTRAYARSQP